MNDDMVIRVKNVKKYYGDIKALDGVSIDIKRGQVFGLLGPNGAGKTTLVKTMATLLRPDSGEIMINGIDVKRQPDQIRSQIGLAGQFASIDEFLTGRENLHMVGRLYHLSKDEVKQRTADVLEQMGLSDAADRPVKTYSGGMRRRIDLAASLVAQPKILFLDEPTTGLDPRTRLDLWNVIEDLVKQGTTILLTTQYLDEADALANYIAIIDRGKLIRQGTADELKDMLGDDVVEFKILNKENKEKALKAVRTVAKKKPTYDEATNKITVPVKNGSKSLLAIIKELEKCNIEPAEISLHRPSLDDVFLSVTGKKTESDIEEKVTPKKRRK